MDLPRSEDARVRLDLVAPPLPRLAKVEPLPLRYLTAPLAAAALGHALRAELARAARMEAPPPGPAAQAPARLEELAPELAEPARRALEAATREVALYVQEAQPTREARAALARAALQLGRLEAASAGYVDRRIGDEEWREDAEDLLAMLDRAPRAELRAYAEGDLLLDVKARQAGRVEADDVRALVLRLLDDRARHPDAPPPREIGLLLGRHGVVWRAPTAPILAHEAWPALAAWRAAESTRDAAPLAPARAPAWVRKRAAAPKEPRTAPEGKAERKKDRAPTRPAPPKPRGTKAPRPRDVEADDEQARPKRKPRPDWRRGSQWRRDRGL